MRHYLDLDRNLIVGAIGVGAMESITGKRSSRGVIQVPIIQDGDLVTDLDDADLADLQLRYVAKLPGLYDSTALVDIADFVWSATRFQFEASIDWEAVAALNTRFGLQSPSAVDISGGVALTDVITTSAPHGFAVNDRVYHPTLTGGTGLTAGEGNWTYVKTVPSSTSYTLSETEGGATLNFTTDITDGTVRLDPEDTAEVDLAIELGHRFDAGDEWTGSNNAVDLTLENNYLRNSETPSSIASGSWLDFWTLRNPGYWTAYEGGEPTHVDAIVTLDRLTVNQHWVLTGIAGDFAAWRLEEWNGSDTSDPNAGRILPIDADDEDNPVIWIRRNV